MKSNLIECKENKTTQRTLRYVKTDCVITLQMQTYNEYAVKIYNINKNRILMKKSRF